MSEPRILCFDLENTAMLSYHWGRWGQNIRPLQTVEESRVLCFGAKWVGGKYTFKAEYEHGRQEMLETISELLTEADAVVSWNGRRHDSKKIRTEFILEGMDPPKEWQELDLMAVAKKQFAFSSNSLDHVSQQLGVGQKVKHEGFFDIIPKVQNGDEKARRDFAKYQKQDVLLLEKLYDRMFPWIPASMHPNMAIGTDNCVFCGSDDLEKRGFARKPTGVYQQYFCRNCKHWPRGLRRLDTSELRG